VGDYCLSFWRKGKVNHCRIKLKQEMGQTQYYLIDTNCFDSLYSLITHYRNHPLRSQVSIMFNIYIQDVRFDRTISRGQVEQIKLSRKVPILQILLWITSTIVTKVITKANAKVKEKNLFTKAKNLVSFC